MFNMKHLVLISLLFLPFAVNADPISPTTNVVTTSYVQGAVDELDTNKQDKLTSTNVVPDANGSANGFVSAVTASDGTVTVTKAEVTIPVGAATSATRAQIWVQ